MWNDPAERFAVGRIRHHFPEENIADVRPGRRPVSASDEAGAVQSANALATLCLPQCKDGRDFSAPHSQFRFEPMLMAQLVSLLSPQGQRRSLSVRFLY